MADDRIASAIAEKCVFRYGESTISKEKIIEEYLSFIAGNLNPGERSINFAFHTGSICYNIVSLAALMLGCLAYEFSSNDEILASLNKNDLVIFGEKRYRWGGIDGKYMQLITDASGKDGGGTRFINYEKNKHLIRPYFGDAKNTNSKGIRKDKTNRNDFIASVLGISTEEVPSSLDASVVVVADRSEFIDICKNLKIYYNDSKYVELTDVVPISYYTSLDEKLQIGKNLTKDEPVIKVTGKISVARELLLDKSGNRVLGLMVLNEDAIAGNYSELEDILRRKNLGFAFIVAGANRELSEYAANQYDEANFFACTPEKLSTADYKSVVCGNNLTRELSRQINNSMRENHKAIRVNGFWGWEEYKNVKRLLNEVRQSKWDETEKERFLLTSYSLIHLYTTAFFSLRKLEDMVAEGKLSTVVGVPSAKLAELSEMVESGGSLVPKQCEEIREILFEAYVELYNDSPKEQEFIHFLEDHRRGEVAVIVPKAYYVLIYENYFKKNRINIVCVSANRFDKKTEFDSIIVTGDFGGKHFDPLKCNSSPDLVLLLYDFEHRFLSIRESDSSRTDEKLNARMRGLHGEEFKRVAEAIEKKTGREEDRETIRGFLDLDDYVESLGRFDIKRFVAINTGSVETSYTAEVKYVGTFTTGEQILFSKYYSAVVYNPMQGRIEEKSPDKLQAGDVLVFNQRNDFTRNIVDQIYDQLIDEKKLSKEVVEATEKSLHWKEVLRDYQRRQYMSYRDVARTMKRHGCTLQEVAVRQWLVPESHIVGPRNPETMKIIAEVTGDRKMLDNSDEYYEACRIVRKYRRDILDLISRAINEKLSNKNPVEGSVMEIVFDNVDRLSETLELESVMELENVTMVNNSIVNRPISEAEV